MNGELPHFQLDDLPAVNPPQFAPCLGIHLTPCLIFGVFKADSKAPRSYTYQVVSYPTSRYNHISYFHTTNYRDSRTVLNLREQKARLGFEPLTIGPRGRMATAELSLKCSVFELSCERNYL